MGVFRRFERGLEGLVTGPFARVFRSAVQPVEIASALQRELDNSAQVVSRDSSLVPNDFTIELAPSDHERLGPYAQTLSRELADVVNRHAHAQHYSFTGPVTVGFERRDDLSTGRFRVRGSAVAAVMPRGGRPGYPDARQPHQGPGYPPGPGPGPYPGQQPGYGPPPGGPAGPGGPGGPGPGPGQGRGPGQNPQSWPPPGQGPGGPAGPPHGPGQGGGYPGGPGPHPQGPGQGPGQGFGQGPLPSQGSGGPEAEAAPAGPQVPYLEVNGQRHPLDPPGVVLGRGTEADLRITDPGVSRRHAEIRVVKDGASYTVTVHDLGSTNGIVVNGQRVDYAALHDGSQILLGNTLLVLRRPGGVR
ncbi:DUF3662 and FHA domain-containing protein [Actinopolymorpha sp. B11F2]|uniref:DUF3662 and FHA domain-containing protein n=1 Tax=Actinopolymorpha sp. B11F2 TaxID=3160862 RepID=UPI0032E4C498